MPLKLLKMNLIHFFAFVLALSSCVSNNIHEIEYESAVDSEEIEHDIVYHPLSKTFITGDFDGDKKIDTLFEHNISGLTGEEILEIPEGEYYDKMLYINDLDSRIFLSWNYAQGDTLFLGSGFGIAYLINLGDVNKNGNDEIAVVVSSLTMGAIRTCKIFSFCNNQWMEQVSFNIHLFTGHENTSDSPLNGFLYKKNGVWIYYDYQESLDDLLENVQRKLVVQKC